MPQNSIPFLLRYVRYNSVIRTLTKTEMRHKIIVNSVPKSGTHLLMKALELMPGIRRAPIEFGRQRRELLLLCLGTCPSLRAVILPQLQAQKYHFQAGTVNTVAIDVDSPFYLPETAIRRIIHLIHPGWFAMGHMPFSDTMAKIVTEEKVRMITILRDPRDVILSHANYLGHKKTHYMYSLYRELSMENRIMTSIRGVSANDHHPPLANIRERLEGVMAWKSHASGYMTCFEKLIGPQGNGTQKAQISELRAIANHLDIQLDTEHLNKIAQGMYGGTRTFRKGTSGRWQKVFGKEHREACKELIGDYLIELGYEKNLEW